MLGQTTTRSLSQRPKNFRRGLIILWLAIVGTYLMNIYSDLEAIHKYDPEYRKMTPVRYC